MRSCDTGIPVSETSIQGEPLFIKPIGFQDDIQYPRKYLYSNVKPVIKSRSIAKLSPIHFPVCCVFVIQIFCLLISTECPFKTCCFVCRCCRTSLGAASTPPSSSSRTTSGRSSAPTSAARSTSSR